MSTTPHIEVLQSQFDTHIRDSELKYAAYESTIKTLTTQIGMLVEAKVSYKHFAWVMGIMITLLSGMFVYLSGQIHDVAITTHSTELSSAGTKAILEQFFKTPLTK